jgi:hypothetical protein
LTTYRHGATPAFWEAYRALPETVRAIADDKFQLLKANPDHPSLRFKKVEGTDDLWSVRVTRDYRALATFVDGRYVWDWIGDHKEYERRTP